MSDRYYAGPAGTENRCEECAGLCCIIPKIETNAVATFSKTKNRVCENLGLDSSGIGHSCSVYANRRSLGLDDCLFFDCYGSGPHITKALAAKGWFEEDRTVSEEGVDLYDTYFRIAQVLYYARKQDGLFLPSGTEASRKFESDCRKTYAVFVDESRIVLPDGREVGIAELREWYFEGVREYAASRSWFSNVLSFFPKRKNPPS